MPPVRVPVLFVSGPPGVGKTTVGWEVFDRLIQRGEAPALVDLDLLGANWPVPSDDPYNERMKARNLAAVWPNFQGAGATFLIASGVIEGPDHLRLYADAVPDAVPTLCRLTAGPDALRERIVGRGRERDSGVEKLVRRAIELSTRLENDGADLCVDTSERGVADVAEQILAHLDRSSIAPRRSDRRGSAPT